MMFWGGYCGSGFMGGPFFGHWLFPVVILTMILVSSWLLLARKEHRGVVGGSDAALDLLRQRYASGEIDEDEYLLRRENLS